MCASRRVGRVAHPGRGLWAASAPAMPPWVPRGGRHRGCQCRAVRRPVPPESRSVPGEVPAGCGPGHHPGFRAVRLDPFRVSASPFAAPRWSRRLEVPSITGPPLFMAQQQLQQERPNYVFSFDARKAFDTALHGALHLVLRHLSVPPDVIDLLLFLHTVARLRIATAHGLAQPVHMLRGI